MQVLLIAFLSIGIYVVFFIAFIKAVKLVNLHLGFGHALVLVIGLFALLSNNNPVQVNYKPNLHVQFAASTDLQNLHNTEFTIEKNAFHRIVLNLSIGREKETNSIVVSSATAYMNGIHIGTTWEPTSIMLFPIPGTDSVRYVMFATISNKILFFSNVGSDEYSGTIAIR
jgi:hypothetical protein